MFSRSVEKEAFLKSFSLFFSSMALLLALLYYNIYKRELFNFDQRLFSAMRNCSFDLECPDFEIDFADSGSELPYTLKKGDNGVYALFPIDGSSRYMLKIIYPAQSYEKEKNSIAKESALEFLVALIAVLLLSILFSFYAIHPLREALKLTREFVRDILHDFNTPLSIVRLNTRMLKRELRDNKKCLRIEDAVETLLRLQENLKVYLGGHDMEVECFRLDEVVGERIASIKKGYPDIDFEWSLDRAEVRCVKDAMIRILDNILDNACKYNVKDGRVFVEVDDSNKRVVIEDSGIGIKNPEKVFERFYREHERGVGIGLHIVKKLCDEMGIDVEVESRMEKGSRFVLHYANVSVSGC